MDQLRGYPKKGSDPFRVELDATNCRAIRLYPQPDHSPHRGSDPFFGYPLSPPNNVARLAESFFCLKATSMEQPGTQPTPFSAWVQLVFSTLLEGLLLLAICVSPWAFGCVHDRFLVWLGYTTVGLMICCLCARLPLPLLKAGSADLGWFHRSTVCLCVPNNTTSKISGGYIVTADRSDHRPAHSGQ